VASSPEAAEDGEFSVSLSVFEGPFNVLLGLIAAKKLELTRVSLTQVTGEFVSYVSHLDLARGADATSSFLLVASVLVEAKSVTLLPGDGARRDSEDLEALRARDLLFARLLQYRAFKQAAGAFSQMMASTAGFHPHPAWREPRFDALRHRVSWQMKPEDFALLAAQVFLNAPRASVSLSQLHVPQADLRRESATVKEKLSTAAQPMLFSDLVADAADRGVVVARFLAVLLFFKMRFLQFRQSDPFAPLSLRWVASEKEYEEQAAQIGEESYD
jgi:segregation and condensation protein A